MIAGISTRQVESTPATDPTLGVASRQQDQRGERRPGAASSNFADALRFGSASRERLSKLSARDAQQPEAAAPQSSGDVVSLSPEAREQLNKLQQRDREVRSHEQAHISSGGPHVAGGARYTYTRGPDGKQYAIGGSVSIDTAPVSDDPEATIEKARMVRSAALAPGSPSAQDQSVAAQAASMEMQAQTDKVKVEEDGEGQDSPQSYKGRKQTALREDDLALAVQGQLAAQAGAARQSQTSTVENASGVNGSGPVQVTPSRLAPSSSAHFLHTTMDASPRNDRVAALYQVQQDRFVPTTMLAPYGTGISLQV